ncbi:MAG: hypothetical protein IPK58_18180 [Acidobacteria bacterium]|nr:hypothetical protein [Acidobacteriota bacterium]
MELREKERLVRADECGDDAFKGEGIQKLRHSFKKDPSVIVAQWRMPYVG